MLTKIHKKHIIFVKTTSFVILACVSLVVLLLLSYFVYRDYQMANRLYPNVYVDGQNLSGKTLAEAKKSLLKIHKPLNRLLVTVVYQDQAIATFSADTLHLQRNVDSQLKKAYKIGRNPKYSARIYQRIGTIFNLIRYTTNTTLSYNKKPIDDFIKTARDNYNKAAENALFQFDGSRVTSFQEEKDGFKINEQRLQSDLQSAILSLNKTTIILEGQVVKPQITLANANNLGIEELVAVGKSNFGGSAPERIHNVALAASKFNGLLIPPSQEFSFNQNIGDISQQTGYDQAYIISGGKTVLGDGGGVCQVSTTLFRAALNAGLPIVQRSAHAYRVGYYENDSGPGFDATVYAPYVDLKIKNDYSTYILVQTEVDYSTDELYFRFYGKRDGRDVYISKSTLTNQQPPPPAKYQDDSTIKKGTVKQTDFAAWGGDSTFQYRVTKNGQVIFEKTFFSSYQPWQAVYLVGQG